MRTNVVTDDQLTAQALELSRLRTQRAVIEEAGVWLVGSSVWIDYFNGLVTPETKIHASVHASG